MVLRPTDRPILHRNEFNPNVAQLITPFWFPTKCDNRFGYSLRMPDDTVVLEMFAIWNRLMK